MKLIGAVVAPGGDQYGVSARTEPASVVVQHHGDLPLLADPETARLIAYRMLEAAEYAERHTPPTRCDRCGKYGIPTVTNPLDADSWSCLTCQET